MAGGAEADNEARRRAADVAHDLSNVAMIIDAELRHLETGRSHSQATAKIRLATDQLYTLARELDVISQQEDADEEGSDESNESS